MADDEFLVADLLSILAAQSASYVAGAVSWVFAERAGFSLLQPLHAALCSRQQGRKQLLHDKAAREQAEPFLTGTTFNNVFNLMYEIEAQLKLLLGVLFNSIVLGIEIDVRLSIAYAVVFTLLMMLQWSLRGRVAHLYLDNQRQNNRVVSHGYTAWDNVFAGNCSISACGSPGSRPGYATACGPRLPPSWPARDLARPAASSASPWCSPP